MAIDTSAALLGPGTPPTLKPFFVASIPLIPPGVNQSYGIGYNKDHKPIFIHTEVAENFLDQARWLFRNHEMAEFTDLQLFLAITESKRKIPLEIELTVYYPTLWARDIDGPEKIVIDSLFGHFKFMAGPGKEKAWNDNRLVDKHTHKRVDTINPRFEIKVSCSLMKEA